MTEIHPSTYSFRHPVHFRYPTPNNISEYAEVNVHPISLMKIECRQEEYLLKEDRDMYRGVAKVPVGDSEKLSIVSLITFISEIMCSLLLVKELRSWYMINQDLNINFPHSNDRRSSLFLALMFVRMDSLHTCPTKTFYSSPSFDVTAYLSQCIAAPDPWADTSCQGFVLSH